MFKFLKTAINNAVENVAPLMRNNRATAEHAWSKIQEEYNKLIASPQLDDPVMLQNSRIEEHLQLLVQALLAEEKEQPNDENGTGPCFEFLLQQNVLDHLCALGIPNRPPGMRPLITATLDSVFHNLRKPLLPNMSVHMAVRQFITVCVGKGDLRNKGSKPRFLSLLRTLCLKLREDAQLAWVFFEEKPQGTEIPEFLLFTSLLSLLNDGDDYANVAIEGLLCCVQLPDHRIARFIIEHTSFAVDLVKGLRSLHETLLPSPSLSVPTEEIPEADKSFELFFKRLALIDVVIASTYPELAHHVAEVLHKEFFEPCLRPTLLSMEENVCIWTTVYLRKMIERTESPIMLDAFISFLVGDAASAETEDEEKLHPIRASLIKRIDSLNADVSSVTLCLFDTLLGTRREKIVHNLVLRNLSECMHILPAFRKRHKALVNYQPVNLNTVLDAFPSLAEAVHDSFYMYGSAHALPTAEVQGPPSLNDDTTLESYLVDAQAEEQLWMEAYASWTSRPRGSAAADGDEADDVAAPVVSIKADVKPAEPALNGVQQHADITSTAAAADQNAAANDVAVKAEDSAATGSADVTAPEAAADAAPEPSSDQPVAGKGGKGKKNKKGGASAPAAAPAAVVAAPVAAESKAAEEKASSAAAIANAGKGKNKRKGGAKTRTALIEEPAEHDAHADETAAAAAAAAASQAADDAAAMTRSASAVSAASDATASTLPLEDDTEPEFYEGLFLSTVFRKLTAVQQSSFVLNLRLTSVLSKLAYCPHPLLHAFMLDPRLPHRRSVRMPLTVLRKSWQHCNDRAQSMPNFKRRVEEARKRLNDSKSTTMETTDVERFLQAMIVLEEFVKELLAICQAKSNLQGLLTKENERNESPPEHLAHD